MTDLYPSWIEIPVTNLERAQAFYRAVFDLTETPFYDDEPPLKIVVLLAPEKSVRGPGVSLVHSAHHKPALHGTGIRVNFHVGEHAQLQAALDRVFVFGGIITAPVVDMDDGVRYATIRDCEGNPIALSSYEPLGVDWGDSDAAS